MRTLMRNNKQHHGNCRQRNQQSLSAWEGRFKLQVFPVELIDGICVSNHWYHGCLVVLSMHECAERCWKVFYTTAMRSPPHKWGLELVWAVIQIPAYLPGAWLLCNSQTMCTARCHQIKTTDWDALLLQGTGLTQLLHAKCKPTKWRFMCQMIYDNGEETKWHGNCRMIYITVPNGIILFSLNKKSLCIWRVRNFESFSASKIKLEIIL